MSYAPPPEILFPGGAYDNLSGNSHEIPRAAPPEGRRRPNDQRTARGAASDTKGQSAKSRPAGAQMARGQPEATSQRATLWAEDGQRGGHRAEGPRAKSQRQRPEGGSRRPEGGQMTRGQPEGWGEEGQRPEGQMQHFFKRTLKHFERAPAQRRGRAVPSHANLQRTVRPPDLRK